MKVKYTPRALQDLDAIRLYIEKDNPAAAWVVASFIRQSIRVLEQFPYHGRATVEKNVRRLVVMNYPYVIYYSVNNKEVLILIVRHTAQGL